MPADFPDDAPPLQESGSDGPSPRRGAVDLRSVVVRQEFGADRRTVYPAEADDRERLTRWISADDDAFRDLDESR